MYKLVTFFLIILCCKFAFSQDKLKHEVYFDTDEYDLSSTEESRLLLFISDISNIEIESISIFGFCDDIGANSYNLKLSKQRANTIKTFFSNNEISEKLISNVDGKGEVLLKIVNEKNIVRVRGLNRKAEIIVKPKLIEVIEETVIEEAKPIVKEKTVTEKIKGDLKAGDKLILKTILFNTGYATVSPESKKTLDSIGEALAKRKDIYFTIQGHVCCTQFSRDAVNRATKKRNLSEARAKYVYDYFVKKGVDKRRMRHLGMRRKFPLGGDPKFDRRVEILITYVGH